MTGISSINSGRIFNNTHLDDLMNASRSGVVGKSDNHGVEARSSYFSGIAKIVSKFSSQARETNKEAKLNFMIALKSEFKLDEDALKTLETRIGVKSGEPLKMSDAQNILTELFVDRTNRQDGRESHYGVQNESGRYLPVDHVGSDKVSSALSYTTEKFNEFFDKEDSLDDLGQKPVRNETKLSTEGMFPSIPNPEDMVSEVERDLKKTETNETVDPNTVAPPIDDIIYGKVGSGGDELGDLLNEISGHKASVQDVLGDIIGEIEDQLEKNDVENETKMSNDDFDKLIYGSKTDGKDELGDLLTEINSKYGGPSFDDLVKKFGGEDTDKPSDVKDGKPEVKPFDQEAMKQRNAHILNKVMGNAQPIAPPIIQDNK